MIEAAFGAGRAWSVGAEEEVMILDAETLALAPGVGTLLAEADGADLPGVLKTELFASVVELNTRPSADAGEAAEALAGLRRFADGAARRDGLRIAAAGTHPFSRPEEQEIAPEPRYREFVEYAGISARMQGVSGLHVHVAMPDAGACWRAVEGVLPWLPLVLALSANSPYLSGEETGLASCRAQVLAQLPRHGAPPAFGSYEAWEREVERFARLGVAKEYTLFWWDVRPHPRFGTLEVRMPDQPTSLRRSGAFVALLQALCVTAARGPDVAVDPASRGDYQQNRWAALRFGPDAELIHPSGERVATVPELAAELLERVAPAARELGCEELLASLDPAVGEGRRQLEVGRADGTFAVAVDLVERSVP